MATDVQTRYETIVEDNIAQVRHKIRLADLGRGVLALACLLFGYALVVAVLDLTMGGSDGWASLTVRLVAFLGMLTGAVYLGLRIAKRFVTNVNPYYAARRLEESIPDSKNSIVNWLDLKDAPLPPAIHNAVGMRAARDLKDADPDLVAAPRDKWKLAGSTVIFVVGLIALFAVVPHQFGTLMARAFVPLRPSTFAPATTIEVLKPKTSDVPANQRVEFLVKIDGRIPAANTPGAPTLHYRHTTNDVAVRTPLEEDVNGHWGTRLSPDQLRTGLYWKVTAGDASTPETQLRVRAQPFVARFEATYTYRPYRKLAPHVVKMPSESMPTPRIFGHRGTNVVLKAFTNVPVKSGQLDLDFGGGVKRSLPADFADPQTLVFRLPLEKSGTFRVAFETADGERNHDRSSYAFDVFEDGAPIVELVKPGKDLVAPPDGTVLLAGVAMDDFGVASLSLQMALKTKTGTQPMAAIPYVPKTKLQFDDGTYPPRVEYVDAMLLERLRTADKRPVALTTGDELTYWLEATDNCDVGGRANVGKSRSFKVTIQEGLKPSMQRTTERKEIQKTKEQHDDAQAKQHEKENQERGQGGKDQSNGGGGQSDGNKDGPKDDKNPDGKGGNQGNPDGKGGNDGPPDTKKDPQQKGSDQSNGGKGGGDPKGQPSPDEQKKKDLEDKLGKMADNLNQALAKNDGSQKNPPDSSPKPGDKQPDPKSGEQSPKGNNPNDGGKGSPDPKQNDGAKKDAGDGGTNKKESPKDDGPGNNPTPKDGGDGSGQEKGAKPDSGKKGDAGGNAPKGVGEKSDDSAKDPKEAKSGNSGGKTAGNETEKKSQVESSKDGPKEATPGKGSDGGGVGKESNKAGAVDKTEKGTTNDKGKIESSDAKPQGPPTQVKGETPPSKKAGEKSGPPTKEEVEAVREMLKQKNPAARPAANDLKNRSQEIPDADVAKMVDDLLREAGKQGAPSREEVDKLDEMLKKNDPQADAAAKDLVDRAGDQPKDDPVRKALEDVLKDAKRQEDLKKLAGDSPRETAPQPEKVDPKQPGNALSPQTGPGGRGVLEELKGITPEAAFARRLGDLQLENLDDLKKRIGPNELKKANVSPEEWQQFLEYVRQYRELTEKMRRRDDAKFLPAAAGKIANQGPRDVQTNPNSLNPLEGAQVAPPWEFRDLQRRMSSKQKSP